MIKVASILISLCNLCITSYTITNNIRFCEFNMGQKTALEAFKSNWQPVGKVVPGWGAVPIMTVIAFYF